MMWDSIGLMALIDLIIIFCAIYVIYIFRETSSKAVSLGFEKSLIPVLAAVCIIALFYLIDLYSMFVMPWLFGMPTAMQFMADLHLNWNWLVTLSAVSSLAFGVNRLLKWVIPNTERLIHDISVAKASLQMANTKLERTVIERTQELRETNAILVRKLEALETSERALEMSEQQFRLLYNETPSMFMTFDREAGIISINQFASDILGYGIEELREQDCSFIFPEEDAKIERRFIMNCFEHPQEVFEIELRQRLRSGRTIWVRQTGRSLPTPDGQWVVLVASEDITNARILSEQLSYHAKHDDLTGLYNRRELERRLQHLLKMPDFKAKKHTLLFLDLDQIKVVNDTCGHAAGDELLRQISVQLKDQLRSNDMLARLGGDEFGIILQSCPIKQAAHCAEKIRKEIEKTRFVWDKHSFRVSASIGLVEFDSNDGEVAQLLSSADAACYEAKDRGRNLIHICDMNNGDPHSKQREMQWISRLQHALDEDKFILYYQPIVAIDSDDFGQLYSHYEILLRLNDTGDEIISPGAFLPAAERYGLSDSIDLWVVENTLKKLADHPHHLDSLSMCSINLSAQSISNHSSLDKIIELISTLAFPAHKICFEITETIAISDLKSACHFMHVLQEIGCKFALDDFGSGLSSFGYLKNLPVDYLKIDGIFVKDIVQNPIDLEMVKSINQIGHVMGKKTVAEYVENQAILDMLRSIGVDYAQGYGLASPQPLEGLLTNESCISA
ncbi:putative bifunctional diguanylate cyclase/phosphodiesterase [Amphritea sp. HPY]|uniref:putative bifunctional diguanylate cyclase/phosphodiesterase n=1 Tax=Amphritea sp. HPY TaxID=3421652 RepID=UPI003D7D1E40